MNDGKTYKLCSNNNNLIDNTKTDLITTDIDKIIFGHLGITALGVHKFLGNMPIFKSSLIIVKDMIIEKTQELLNAEPIFIGLSKIIKKEIYNIEEINETRPLKGQKRGKGKSWNEIKYF